MGIAALSKIRHLGSGGKNTVRSKVDIFAAVSFHQGATVGREENRDGVGHQKHMSCKTSRRTVDAWITHAGVSQVDIIHQVVQRNVGVKTGQPHQCRN